MTQITPTTQQPKLQETPVPKRPTDSGSFHLEGFVRIFDPNSKEVYVEKRA